MELSAGACGVVSRRHRRSFDCRVPGISKRAPCSRRCMVILIATMPVAGLLADRFGYQIVLAAATLVTGVLVYPLFVWIDSGTVIATSVTLTIFALTNGCIQGVMPVAMADMFPARLRFSGMAIGYNLTLALVGGTAPLVATWLITITGRLTAPAWYLVVIAAGTFIVTLTVQPHRENPVKP